MATAAPSDLAARYHISDPVQRQIAGFTTQSATQIYGATIRKNMVALGYGDRPVEITDPAVLSKLQAHGERVASSVQTTVNRMIDNQMAKDPAGMADLIDGFNGYNASTLIPFTSNWAAQQGTSDFYSQNGIEAMWSCEPTDTAGLDDECDEAVAASPMTADEAAAYDLPAHPNCPHEMVPGDVNEDTLPPESDLWNG